MPNDKSTEAAKHILDDRNGADYYQDIHLLSNYLQGMLGLSRVDAAKTAKAIQEDRSGANYYENIEVLAGFLRR